MSGCSRLTAPRILAANTHRKQSRRGRGKCRAAQPAFGGERNFQALRDQDIVGNGVPTYDREICNRVPTLVPGDGKKLFHDTDRHTHCGNMAPALENAFCVTQPKEILVESGRAVAKGV
jgi:hypothetical protein